MGDERIKTEHAGAKNGGGAWMTRAEAKQTAKRQRRRSDQVEAGLGVFDGLYEPGYLKRLRSE